MSGLISRLISLVRVNEVAMLCLDGQTFWLKKRRRGYRFIIEAGNIFLTCSRSNIIMFAHPQHWQDWEIHSYRLLYGNCFVAQADGNRAVLLEEIPGQSLRQYLSQDLLTPTIIEAAAHEFRRVHQLACPRLQAPWSHGDPHLGNVLYDPHSDRARLIDFETRHIPTLRSADRHTDDLLVFLLDLLGHDQSENWLPLSLHFLRGYNQPALWPVLQQRLVKPRGLELILWKARTEHLATDRLYHRVDALRDNLATLMN